MVAAAHNPGAFKACQRLGLRLRPRRDVSAGTALRARARARSARRPSSPNPAPAGRCGAAKPRLRRGARSARFSEEQGPAQSIGPGRPCDGLRRPCDGDVLSWRRACGGSTLTTTGADRARRRRAPIGHCDELGEVEGKRGEVRAAGSPSPQSWRSSVTRIIDTGRRTRATG